MNAPDQPRGAGGHLERRWPLALAGVGLVAAGVRLALAWSLWSLPHRYLLNADAGVYHELSLAIAGLGDGQLPPVFGLSPLTFAWGAWWHWLCGPSVWAVVIPGIALGAGTSTLTASCGRRVGSAGSGMVAGLLVALSGPLAFYDVAPLATSLAVFLATLTVRLCLALAGRPSLPRAAALGLAVGLWITCRPNAALFVPLALALPLALRALPRSRRLLLGGALLIATTLTVAPVTIANAVRGGVFVPVTASAGINLFIGNNQGATGRLEPVFDDHHADATFAAYTARAETATGHPLDPAAVSSFWVAQTGREIADAPGRFAALLGRKLVYALNDFETPDSWNLPFLRTRLPLLPAALPGFGLLFPLGALGLLLLWRRGPPGRRALHGLALVSLATMLAFFVADRYRAPLLPVLAVGCGSALFWLGERLAVVRHATDEASRRRAAVLLAAAALWIAVAATTAHLPILRTDAGLEITRLCRAYALEGRAAEVDTCRRMTIAREKSVNFVPPRN